MFDKQTVNYYLKILVLTIAAASFIYLMPGSVISPEYQTGNDTLEVTDFASCVAAGYPVMESYPSRCITPDGRNFEDPNARISEVLLESPAFGQVVASPLEVKGQALGTWFFEANIPVTLKDEQGKVLAQKGMQAQEDWMTSDFVTFSGVLEFASPQTEFGVLIIEKDNPSGLPENDASYAVPVRFR